MAIILCNDWLVIGSKVTTEEQFVVQVRSLDTYSIFSNVMITINSRRIGMNNFSQSKRCPQQQWPKN